jgi:hypothetical protein
VTSFDPAAYGPAFAPLLAIDRRRALDAGRPDTGAEAALRKRPAEAAFAHVAMSGGRVTDANMAACCLAGVWLLHDYLDESHKLSQNIDTPSGSFWHSIMHRREGDFSNAKYWFRHVGRHPVFAALGQQLHVATWDPFAFVDLCESVSRGTSDARERCLDIQQAEWELLFDYCYQAAVGA